MATAYKGSSNDIQQKIRRVVEVWRQRSIFELPIQEAVEARVDGKVTPTSICGPAAHIIRNRQVAFHWQEAVARWLAIFKPIRFNTVGVATVGSAPGITFKGGRCLWDVWHGCQFRIRKDE